MDNFSHWTTKEKNKEAIERIRIKLLGRKLSKSHRNNISKGLKGRIISQKTRDKISKSNTKPRKDFRGKGNPAYTNGRVNLHGYILIFNPNRNYNNKKDKKYLREHRYIMEKHIGRKLTNKEIVHHKNGIKNDNRIENLEIMSLAEHARYHSSLRSNLCPYIIK